MKIRVRQDVYNTYWKFAAERQEVFFKKLRGEEPPYSSDPILNTYKFCNTYRASDRVSQFLIKNVIYKPGNFTESDTLFRIFLFRLLNKIETWQRLENRFGEVGLKNFSFSYYSQELTDIKSQGKTIYGNAFILCANKAFGFDRKHENHLVLLEKVFMKERLDKKLIGSKNLGELFVRLRELPLIGDFMAYQLAIDFNYSEVFNFDENEFTVAGPGALRGINKCFLALREEPSKIIMYMVDNQDREFARLGIRFQNLFGRSLKAIDCQGLFCEVDKYSRVKFPTIKSNRKRIKTKYTSQKEQINYFYPPKWDLNTRIRTFFGLD